MTKKITIVLTVALGAALAGAQITPGGPGTRSPQASGAAGAKGATAGETQSGNGPAKPTGNPGNPSATSNEMSTQAATASSAAKATPITEDGELQGLIQSALHDEPMLTSKDIRVNVSATRIVLTGSVSTAKQKVAAERVAKSFATNRQVVDHITVREQP